MFDRNVNQTPRMRGNRALTRIGFLLLSIFGIVCSASTSDILLKNLSIYDGSGKKAFHGDVRIHDDHITNVGKHLRAQPGDQVVDEHGLALAPGFTDMHSHADAGIFKDLNAENVIRQGVTTVLVGQDGVSEYPLADFLNKLDKQPAAMNFASMVGQSTIRMQVMGKDFLRPSTPDELAKMRDLLAKEMSAGSFGLSTGLEYESAHFSTTEEVVALSKIAAADGGFYISHVRDEGNGVFDSFREIIKIGADAHLPVEISHIKLATTPVWHMAATRMPAVFEDARRQGVDLKADVYPYTFWESTIRVIVLDHDYFNPAKVSKAIADNGGADHLRFIDYDPDPSIVGKTLQDAANMWHVTPVEAYMRIVKNGSEPGKDASVMGEAMSEDDLRWFIANPRIMFCSDGGLHDSHPRGAGSFPRVLGRYVREQKVLSMQEAIHKMTEMPAQQLGLRDHGLVAPGYVADLVVFDPATVADGSTVQNSEAPPAGIEDVMVSGVWVVDKGKVTGAHPGKVLRHPRTIQ
jgi:N-acyl-D-amino-acid deacylase